MSPAPPLPTPEALVRATVAPAPAFDVAVIGAGPAGLAAAAEASACGARVAMIDMAEQPGGQFWRHRSEAAGIADDGRLHHGWRTYLALRSDCDAAIERGTLRYIPRSTVWMVSREAGAVPSRGFLLRLARSYGPGAHETPTIRAARLVLATGAYDRQIPVPGWQLPGVMAAGGIQGFGKQNGALPASRFVIAGTGPFLLSVAAGIVQQGGSVAAVLESSDLRGWLPRAHRAAGVPAKALEGAEYIASFLRHRIPYRTRTVITEVLGDSHVTGVRTARIDRRGAEIPGSSRTIDDIDGVGLGWGFTPQMELPLQLGVATRVDLDGSLVAVVNARMESSVAGVFLAGETTGVGGAALAVIEGRIAGRAAAAAPTGDAAGAPSKAARPEPAAGPTPAERRALARQRNFAAAMHQAHPMPAGWQSFLRDDTVVCRCEEVSAGTLREAHREMAAGDQRTKKGLTRAGMGWCQGRVCGFAVSCLSADGTAPHRSLDQSANRPIAGPLPLSDIAALADETAAGE